MCKLNYYGNCDPETEDEEYCIFHRPDKNEEEAEEFWRKFFDRFKPDEEEIEIEGRRIRRFIFKENLNCSGYVFPKFPEGAKIGVKARPFYYSIFKGSADFSWAKFEEGAAFLGATFSEAAFLGATFSEAYFSRAKFEEGADFSWATFSEAYFSEVTFSVADFSMAKFEEIADFLGATFSKAYFSGATFSEAYFSRAKFEEVAYFSGATFSEAYFSGATFSVADFSRAEFEEIADFSGATFSKAYFSGATFSVADFSRAEFEEIADFSGATFSKAYFSGATFSVADFSRAEFEEIADFSLAKFKKSVMFSDARFHDFTNFSRAEFPTLEDADLLPHASFRGAYFEHPERVVFDGIEGKVKISFINADISRVVFRNCSFDFLYDEYLLKNREELEKELKDLKQPITHMVGTSEELILETLSRELADLTLDNVLSVIRMLRENFDYYMKYEESGRLFVKEMDLKRAHMLKGGSGKLKIAKRIEWLAYSLYRWTCLYGESISRPLILASAIIIGFGILRAIPPIEALLASLLGGNISAVAEFLRALAGSLAEGIRGSLIDFLQLGRDYGWLNLLERVASAMNLATLYISLHRKLERRIRH